MATVAPLPVYREVKPSLGFMRRFASPRYYKPGRNWITKLKFNLVHLVYTLRKFRPDVLREAGIYNLSSFKEDLQLERVFLYFRLLQKHLPKEYSFGGSDFEASEGHELGGSFGNLTFPEFNSELITSECGDAEPSLTDLSNSAFASHIRERRFRTLTGRR